MRWCLSIRTSAIAAAAFALFGPALLLAGFSSAWLALIACLATIGLIWLLAGSAGREMRSIGAFLDLLSARDYGAVLPSSACREFETLAEKARAATGAFKQDLGFYKSVVLGFPLPMLSVDREARITHVNQSALDMLQIPGKAQDWLGRKAGEFFYEDPNHDTNVAKVMREIMDKITGESTLTGRRGRKVRVQADRLKLFDLDGCLIGGLCVYTDLTAIKESEQLALDRSESMRHVAGQMEEITLGLLAASESLDREISLVAKGALEQSERILHEAKSVQDLDASVSRVAANAEAASGEALETERSAQEGFQVVERSVEAIDKVDKTARDLARNMSTLTERSQSIGRVLEMITDIADQTNLLALNAAIEAARAGDAGRGFAVVADEVRKLAEKTMSATKEVGESIAAIQESAAANLDRMRQAVELIEQSTRLASESGEALSRIVDMARTNAGRAREIADAAEAQSQTAGSVATGMKDVRRIAEETSDRMGKAAQAVHDLTGTAGSIKLLVGKLGSDG